MSKLSPSLNSRLAKIEITQNQKTPSKPSRSPKKYPESLYPKGQHPNNQITLSRAPVLSTAKRAQSRSSSSSKHNSEPVPDALHDRKLHKSTLSSASSNSTRTPRKPSGPDVHFSFMRETASSRKKQHAAVELPNLQSHRSHQERSFSHPEFYNKRPCTQFVSSKSQGKKNTANQGPTIAPPEILNLPQVPRSKQPSPQKICQSASTNDISMYLRDETPKLRPSPLKELSRLSGYRLLSSVWRQEKSILPQNPQIQKVATLLEMYSTLYATDPELFSNPHTLDPDLELNSPILPHQVNSHRKGQSLSVYERGEIMRKQHIYFLPEPEAKSVNMNSLSSADYKSNFGFDDENGNYTVSIGDHIEYRYEIQRILGTGSFGNVVLCVDHKFSTPQRKRKVAIKIIRNDLNWSLQAVSEIKMLKQLNQSSKGGTDHIMQYYDHFHFRGHMCIASEVLSLNLFTFLELFSFRGVNLQILKYFTSDILKGLKFIHEQGVIHCDIKPENIMIKLPVDYDPTSEYEPSVFEVKLIDFGSSCQENESSFSYIQSRFYRAPEVILGTKYSSKIDIWSLGCVLAELFTGAPLLPGKSELEQIALILELIGAPSVSFVINERKKLMRFARSSPTKVRDPVSAGSSVESNNLGSSIDEKKIKRTLLYSLFTIDGKVNLQFLNLLLLATSKDSSSSSSLKKNVKLNSRSLDVCLRLLNYGEPDAPLFSRFMSRFFCWNPQDRPTAEKLLEDPFLQGIKSPQY